MRLDEIQHRAIDPRSLRLHEIENEFRRSVAALVHDADGWIKTPGNGFDPNIAFEGSVT